MTDPANRIYVDYLDYTNQQRADILNALGRVIKEATGGKSLVSVFNAYHTEVYSAASGSFGARHLIDSPYIDCIAGPVSYEDRNEGGMGAYYTFVNSLALSGKLWIDEGDYRTTFKTAPGSNPTGGGQDGVGTACPSSRAPKTSTRCSSGSSASKWYSLPAPGILTWWSGAGSTTRRSGS